MPRAPDPPVSPEQLRLAYRLVQRPGWPSTLEAALAHPTYCVCLYGIARNLGRVGMDKAPLRSAQPELPFHAEAHDARLPPVPLPPHQPHEGASP